jgi:hypothetical protein
VIVGDHRPGSLKERLDVASFQAVRQRVFRERRTTLDLEAAPFTIDDLRLALGVIRLGMRTEVEWLPLAAYEAQPAGSSGNEVWTAGQVVNHIGNTQIGLTGWLHQALGLAAADTEHPLVNLTDEDEPGLLTREQSIHVLDVAERELELMFDAIPDCLDDGMRARHPAFGIAGVKGGLLMMAIHEHEHLSQLIDLRG